MPKSTGGRRLLLRRCPVRDSDWTSTVPSAYEISFLNSSCEPHAATTTASIESFNNYVEFQRCLKGRKGCRSLRDMAIEMVLKYLSEVDNLNYLPKHLTRSMWHILKRRCMLSFHSWKILSKALYKEDNDVTFGMFQYSKSIQCSKSPLNVYIQPLISKTFDFITSLSININCTIVDMVQLTKISNLGILEIINPNPEGEIPSGVRDVVVRTWSREVKESGAFSVLRILRLWHHQDLTEKALQHILSFPALAIFDMRDCGMDGYEKWACEAEKLGWLTTVEADLFRKLEEKCKEKQNKMSATLGCLIPQQTEKGFDKILWPDSRVQRIKNPNMQSFLAQYVEENDAVCPNHVKDSTDGDEEWVSMSWDIFRKTKHNDLWDSDLRALWTRIGELREDCDLKTAGIEGIERIFIGQQAISPVPMAYIRLLDVHQSVKRSGGEMSTVFIPKLIEQPTTPKSDFQSEVESSWLDSRSIGNQRGRPLGKLRALKRQRLGDILNGFTAGK